MIHLKVTANHLFYRSFLFNSILFSENLYVSFGCFINSICSLWLHIINQTNEMSSIDVVQTFELVKAHFRTREKSTYFAHLYYFPTQNSVQSDMSNQKSPKKLLFSQENTNLCNKLYLLVAY